jgi:hypothetical protein
VKWNQCASPVETTPVLMHTLKPEYLFTLGGTTEVMPFPKRFMR